MTRNSQSGEPVFQLPMLGLVPALFFMTLLSCAVAEWGESQKWWGTDIDGLVWCANQMPVGDCEVLRAQTNDLPFDISFSQSMLFGDVYLLETAHHERFLVTRSFFEPTAYRAFERLPSGPVGGSSE
ncbi:hypothetical protein ACFOY8_14685 [Thalassospira xianhensis]|uniref:Lipoprotein n=1 Tax=Thalassospira xianhensis MCCC 1A02616 TaxID=1177929 RepID=A0A367UJU6_9PROT|nr:hypothetical protein [Thalassospira xianhensis]RCK07604.1 hypothetical protein TH5_00550 [Thalassospira xianhensis MCCC 1A02616]